MHTYIDVASGPSKLDITEIASTTTIFPGQKRNYQMKLIDWDDRIMTRFSVLSFALESNDGLLIGSNLQFTPKETNGYQLGDNYGTMAFDPILSKTSKAVGSNITIQFKVKNEASNTTDESLSRNLTYQVTGCEYASFAAAEGYLYHKDNNEWTCIKARCQVATFTDLQTLLIVGFVIAEVVLILSLPINIVHLLSLIIKRINGHVTFFWTRFAVLCLELLFALLGVISSILFFAREMTFHLWNPVLAVLEHIGHGFIGFQLLIHVASLIGIIVLLLQLSNALLVNKPSQIATGLMSGLIAVALFVSVVSVWVVYMILYYKNSFDEFYVYNLTSIFCVSVGVLLLGTLIMSLAGVLYYYFLFKKMHLVSKWNRLTYQ